ncbi:MAG: aldo/keto reductase, partial [Spirochaetales bacterium]
LTGKYNEGIPEGSRLSLPGYEWLKNRFFSEEGKRMIEKAKKLTTLSEDLGTSLNKLAIAWCLKNPHVSTVILGASRVEQLIDNLKAMEVVPMLTGEVMQQIEGILR